MNKSKKLPKYKNIRISPVEYSRFYLLAEKITLMCGEEEIPPPGQIFEMMLSFMEKLVDEKDASKIHYFNDRGGLN